MVNNMPTRPVRNASTEGSLIRQLEQLKKEFAQLQESKDLLGVENEQLKERINEYEQRIQALEENNAKDIANLQRLRDKVPHD